MLTSFRSLLTQLKLLLWRPSTYAQTGEDLILEALAGEQKITSYLELGGCHPVYLSGSYKFYKAGAKGVIVEPNPLLARLYKFWRPRDTVVQAAIVAKPQNSITFYRFVAATLNTTDAAEAAALAEQGYQALPTITVPALTPEALLKQHFPITAPDVLSLDIEGGEDAILSAWPWENERARPRFVVLETLSYTTRTPYQARIDAMLTRGYRVAASTHINTIFARIDEAKVAPKKRKA
jgi:FkbM family methyltransferase